MKYILNIIVEAVNTPSYIYKIFVGLGTALYKVKVVDKNEYYLNFNTPKYTRETTNFIMGDDFIMFYLLIGVESILPFTG